MKATYIDYSETRSFSEGLIRYLANYPELAPFSAERADIEGFRNLINRKNTHADRKILVDALSEQYSKIGRPAHSSVQQNIQLLLNENTFTVCTGHQLNLFTGPLYFIFKIVTAINLAKELKSKFPDKDFVPVYWMATEDHDFEEINYFNFQNVKIKWERESFGPVGRLSTAGLEEVYEVPSKGREGFY